MKTTFLHSKNYFPVPVEPPIGGGGSGGLGGGGASGTGMILNSYVVNTPNNSYFDFGSAATTTFEYVVDVYDVDFRAIDYFMETSAGINFSPIKKINGFGAVITSGYSWSSPSSYFTGRISIDRVVSGPGKFKDSTKWWVQNRDLYGNPSGLVQFSTTAYNYIYLQKSVAILKYKEGANPFTPISPNSTRSIVTNNVISLDKSSSRGKEVSSVWTFLKTDPNGTYQSIPAVNNVDYEFVSGGVGSDIIDIKFLSNNNFEVKVTVAGHTFDNNPYMVFPSQNVPNFNEAVYYFQTEAPAVTYEIKIPELSIGLFVPTSVLIGTTPFETYQNQQITVNSIVNLATGYWKKLEGSLPPVTIVKTEAEWRAEITSKCNIFFEARDKVTNNLIFTRTGLGPFTIAFTAASNYNLQFITTLK